MSVNRIQAQAVPGPELVDGGAHLVQDLDESSMAFDGALELRFTEITELSPSRGRFEASGPGSAN